MSCAGKRTRIKNLLVKKQAADVWTPPTAENNLRLDAGAIMQATPEQIERDILKSSYTPEVNLAGILVATMTGVSEMFGAVYSAIVKPWFTDLFNAAGLIEFQLMEIPVSAIATQFVHNEIVTGAVGVGRVVVPTVAGDTTVIIEVTTPAFAAETITGSISGSATATGVEVIRGWSFKFDTSSCIRLSAQSEEDGQISQIYNAVPTLSIVAEAGKIPKINYELAGVIRDLAGVARWMRDGAMTDLTGFRSEVIPPKYVDARLKLDDGANVWSPVVDSSTTIDTAIERNLRVDANNPLGAEGYLLTGRGPLSSYRVNTPTNAEKEIWKDWFAASAIATEFRIGKDVNNTFWFFTPSARFQNITPADENGEMKQDLEFSLTGQDDQELEIVCI
jgi:hypothetical protein